jgi:hypothetical protein
MKENSNVHQMYIPDEVKTDAVMLLVLPKIVSELTASNSN